MAISISEPTADTTDSSNTTSYAMGAFTPAANCLLVVMVATSDTVAAGSMSGGSLTWVKLNGPITNSTWSAYMFAAYTGPSPASCTPTFDCTGDAASGCLLACFQVTVAAGNVVFIVQTQSSTGSSVSPASGTLAALGTGNAYMFGYVQSAKLATQNTPPTSWTEIADNAYTVPATGNGAMYRVGGETGTSITATSATNNVWASTFIEVREDTLMPGQIW